MSCKSQILGRCLLKREVAPVEKNKVGWEVEVCRSAVMVVEETGSLEELPRRGTMAFDYKVRELLKMVGHKAKVLLVTAGHKTRMPLEAVGHRTKNLCASRVPGTCELNRASNESSRIQRWPVIIKRQLLPAPHRRLVVTSPQSQAFDM